VYKVPFAIAESIFVHLKHYSGTVLYSTVYVRRANLTPLQSHINENGVVSATTKNKSSNSSTVYDILYT
jgi:hypothetical protein